MSTQPVDKNGSRSRLATTMIVAAAAMVILLGVALFLLLDDRDTAADFEFTTYQGDDILGGSRINFSDVLGQEKAVVLNFWGG